MTPDAISIEQQNTIFEFGLPYIIAHSQSKITVPLPVPSYHGFLQDSFILSFSLKNMNRGMPTELPAL